MRKLTEDQLNIIDHFNTPIAIWSAAGTGKTTTLAHKIARIFEQDDENRILALSHSSKASKSLRGWVGQIIGDDGRRIRFDPFEPVCLEWIRQFSFKLGLSPLFSVVDRVEQYKIAVALFSATDCAPSERLLQIRRLKLKGIGESQSDLINDVLLQTDYQAYQSYLALSHAIDRDDIVRLAAHLVRNHPDVCRDIAAKYSYWVIDQVEDLSQVHCQIIEAIFPYLTHLTLAGDRSQSIGGDLGIVGQSMDELIKGVPGLLVMDLTTSFRSKNAIVDIVRSLRKGDHVFSNNEEFIEADDDSMIYFLAFDEVEEAQYVVDEIISIRRDECLSLNDFCVMYRTPAQAVAFEDQLRQKGLRFRSIGRSLSDPTQEIHELILYLRALVNPADRPAIAQLLTLPPFLMEESDVASVLAIIPKTANGLLDLQGMLLSLSSDVDAKLTGLIDLLAHWFSEISEEPGMLAGTLLAKIAEDSGYRMLLEEENTLETIERLQVIDDFIAMAVDAEWSIDQLLNFVSVGREYDEDDISGDAVNVIPLNMAKGYEFPVVFVCGLEEGLIPYYTAQFDDDSIDAERRLLYLGASRAKRRLIFTSAFRRSMFGAEWSDDVSRFIREIPRNRLSCFFSERISESRGGILEQLRQDGFHIQTWEPLAALATPKLTRRFVDGDVVDHPSWGRGVIQKIEGDDDKMMLHIQFGEQLRKVMAKYADVVKR